MVVLRYINRWLAIVWLLWNHPGCGVLLFYENFGIRVSFSPWNVPIVWLKNVIFSQDNIDHYISSIDQAHLPHSTYHQQTVLIKEIPQLNPVKLTKSNRIPWRNHKAARVYNNSPKIQLHHFQSHRNKSQLLNSWRKDCSYDMACRKRCNVSKWHHLFIVEGFIFRKFKQLESITKYLTNNQGKHC